jgi:hypothetical protein
MYGIINVAIQDFAVENYGVEKWEIIKDQIGLDVDFSLSDNPYNDGIPVKVAEAASKEMGLVQDEVLNEIGESIIPTTSKKFGSFIASRGNTLRDYLINLPNFHNRIALIYPELTPPQFRVSHLGENTLHLHYLTKTKGIRWFIKGYLTGLVSMFNENATVEFLQSREDGNLQEIFKISW